MDIFGSIGNAFEGFMGTNRSAPGAPDLGFDQGRYDDLLKKREGYIGKFEGYTDDSGKYVPGYADRAAGIGTQYGGLMDNVLGKVGADGTRTGGLYGDVMGKDGLRDQAKGLQANAGDIDYLMKDQGLYAGLAEQQRAGQDKANQEMLRRSLANESGGSRSGFLNRFKGMTDPLGEQRAGDALQAANMSMQNRQGMLGQQGQMLNQQSNLINQGMQMQNQAGNFLGNQLTALGQESGYGSMGYQDAIAQMNALDQARLAQAGMDFQGDMANFNRPTGFDQALGLMSAAGGSGGGFMGLGKR